MKTASAGTWQQFSAMTKASAVWIRAAETVHMSHRARGTSTFWRMTLDKFKPTGLDPQPWRGSHGWRFIGNVVNDKVGPIVEEMSHAL